MRKNRFSVRPASNIHLYACLKRTRRLVRLKYLRKIEVLEFKVFKRSICVKLAVGMTTYSLEIAIIFRKFCTWFVIPL